MLTATQYDIFGSERAADPTGRRKSLAEHTERCNLCCVPFDNTELPPVGHFFYLGFHICERCHTAFTEAAEDKRNGKKVRHWRDVDFYIAPKGRAGDYSEEVMVRRGGTIAVVIGNCVAGFVGNAQSLTHWIGANISNLIAYRKLEHETVTAQLLDLATDTGIINDDAMSYTVYRYDKMIAEMYDNIAYNRLEFNDVKEA